jgi:hypothetical protein
VPGQLRGTGAVHAVEYFVVVCPKAFDLYRRQLQRRVAAQRHGAMSEMRMRMGLRLSFPMFIASKFYGQFRSHSTAFPVFDLNHPCPDDVLKIWPVDAAVGNVKNNGLELALPFVSS